MHYDTLYGFTTAIYHASWRDLRDDGGVGHLFVEAAYTEAHSSTSLGRAGLAGQAITSALTVAVSHGNRLAVYRHGRLDYIARMSQKVRELCAKHRLPNHTQAREILREDLVVLDGEQRGRGR